MLGRRESLREFVRSESGNLRELVSSESESLRELVSSQGESLRELVSSEGESLRELVSTQHREFMSYQERRDEEFRADRDFNREILLRNEKVYTAVIAEMEEGRKQIKTNTEAVLRMLDRLDSK